MDDRVKMEEMNVLMGEFNFLRGQNDRLIDMVDGLQKKLQGLVEINARLSLEIVNIKNPGGPPDASASVRGNQSESGEKSEKVFIEVLGDIVSIKGKTYDRRHIFHQLGGSWNSEKKYWQVCSTRYTELLRLLDNAKTEYETTHTADAGGGGASETMSDDPFI